MPKASRDKMIAKTAREKSIVTKQEEIKAKHEAFANAIAEGASESDAARAAGYHPTSAPRVMRNEEVQQMLAVARQETTNLSTIKRLDVLNIFIDAIEMARTMADPANMINGADKVCKMMGYYEAEKVDIRVTHDTAVFNSKLKQLSDAELMELAAGNRSAIEGACEVVSEAQA
jgi:phage terminase small subunit